MAIIKASCPRCGEVTLTPADIDLRVDAGVRSRSTYGFACPTCGHEVRKPAEERVVRVLISAGVAVREPDPEPDADPVVCHTPSAAPFTHDDLLDFHERLHHDDGWFDDLLASV